MIGRFMRYQVVELYLINSSDNRKRKPASIHDILPLLVDGIELVDAKISARIQAVINELFGLDIGQSIAVSVMKNEGILVCTTREIAPLVKLKSSRLKTLLAAEGITGELRVVVEVKTREAP